MTARTDTDLRAKCAEVVVLAAFDALRERAGHDYGAGQRGAELLRRRRELAPAGATPAIIAGNVVRFTRAGAVEPTDLELAAAARRILAPRLARIEREDYRRHTPATARTLKALKAALAHFAPTYAEAGEEAEPVVELTAEELSESRRIRRALEVRIAGGTNELDESIATLLKRVAAERDRELADAARIGEEYDRTGAYITGQAAASCHKRAEGLTFVLDYAGRLQRAGDVRIAELVLKGSLGDKAAARAAKAYKSDAELEAAERASDAADYTDGGAPAPQSSSSPAPALSLFDEVDR